MARPRKRVLLTESELGSDADEHDADIVSEPQDRGPAPPTSMVRFSRKSKEGASKKWESLVPGQARKKKRTDSELTTGGVDDAGSVAHASFKKQTSGGGDDTDRRTDNQDRSTPPPPRPRVKRIDPNAHSGDELNTPRQVGNKTSSLKIILPPKKRQLQATERESVSLPVHEQSTDDDGHSEEGSSESSGEAEKTDGEDEALAAMEGNPETLEKLFESEKAYWTNEDNNTQVSHAKAPRGRGSVALSSTRRSVSYAPPPNSPSPSSSDREGDVERQSRDTFRGSSQSSSMMSKKKRPLIVDSNESASDSELEEQASLAKLSKSLNVLYPSAGDASDARHARRASPGSTSHFKKLQDTNRRTISRDDEIPKFKESASRPEESGMSTPRGESYARQSGPEDNKHSNTRQNTNGSEDSEEDSSGLSSENNSDSDDSGIELVLPRRGKLKLRDQHRRVRRVLSRSILNVQVQLATKDAFPDGAQKHGKMVYRALLQAAADLGYEDIVKRLRKQDAYADELVKIPSQRIPTYRGAVRKLVEGQASTLFQLKFGAKEKGDWLHSKFRYIYPFDYEKKTHQASKPYTPPVYVETLRAAFFKRAKSLGFKIAHLAQSSLPDKPHEKELPAPLLALVATAIHAAIEDCKLGHRRPRDFSTNEYWGVYKDHMLILTNIRTKGPIQYHVLMHGLWRELYGAMDHPENVADALPDIEAMARE
ncbi:hypothetical protein C8Q77DRAFT_1072694 [Trametes polyzona]|nr:hypothetical protein C8Q77DRAFT_1072694 [Trametes polyzona]